jgi:hypothetical protein
VLSWSNLSLWGLWRASSWGSGVDQVIGSRLLRQVEDDAARLAPQKPVAQPPALFWRRSRHGLGLGSAVQDSVSDELSTPSELGTATMVGYNEHGWGKHTTRPSMGVILMTGSCDNRCGVRSTTQLLAALAVAFPLATACGRSTLPPTPNPHGSTAGNVSTATRTNAITDTETQTGTTMTTPVTIGTNSIATLIQVSAGQYHACGL